MRAKKFAKPAARRTALAATLARFVGQQHFDRLRDLPLLHRFAARKAIPAPDPVSLAVLAIDRVGPASRALIPRADDRFETAPATSGARKTVTYNR